MDELCDWKDVGETSPGQKKNANSVQSTQNSKPIIPPFLGVPIVTKECFEHAGLRYTNGLIKHKSDVGVEDAVLVNRLKKLGFIVVATSNISEACLWSEAYNKVYGRTSNLFDLSRTAGGSSGGSAVSVAGFATPLAVTADIGGSTRIPSVYKKPPNKSGL